MASYEWTGGTGCGGGTANGNDWNDQYNWTPPGVPQDGDSVTIPDVVNSSVTDGSRLSVPAPVIVPPLRLRVPFCPIEMHHSTPPSVGLDAAASPDPARSLPAAAAAKAARRVIVKHLTSNVSTASPGGQASLTVSLTKAAASPGGTLVLLRLSSGSAIIPSSVTVPAGHTSVTVALRIGAGAGSGTVKVTARTLYQLAGAPPTVTVAVS